ncbi:hypothetical protein [Massilia sp. DD77]|uniref:hypothetical protein n=1 Tax=Massilia sp. DD77 TaxID=3109349 RepID=UPI002FFF6A7C
MERVWAMARPCSSLPSTVWTRARTVCMVFFSNWARAFWYWWKNSSEAPTIPGSSVARTSHSR